MTNQILIECSRYYVIDIHVWVLRGVLHLKAVKCRPSCRTPWFNSRDVLFFLVWTETMQWLARDKSTNSWFTLGWNCGTFRTNRLPFLFLHPWRVGYFYSLLAVYPLPSALSQSDPFRWRYVLVPSECIRTSERGELGLQDVLVPERSAEATK